MPNPRVSCSHPECERLVDAGSITGLCREHLNEANASRARPPRPGTRVVRIPQHTGTSWETPYSYVRVTLPEFPWHA